jgi:death-on-curing protein
LIDYLSYEDVLEIAGAILAAVEVADVGLLASAVQRPQITVFGKDAYPALPEKAAALLHGIVRNHALVDGNKRLAWATTRVFLLMNGYRLVYDIGEAEATVVAAAAGELGVPQLADWLQARMRQTDPSSPAPGTR